MSAIKERILSGEQLYGCWLELFDPLVTEIIGQAGYDFVMLDLEHGPGSVKDVVAMLQALNGSATVPLTRVPTNDLVWMKRLLDVGVAGIMVPEVSSVEEATQATSGCRYPPQGCRGVAATVVRASQHGADWEGYIKKANEETLVICQIETQAGLLAIEDIAAVDGVDVLFIGPFDLSAALGHIGEPDHPNVREAITHIEAVAKATGKILGGVATPKRGASELFAAGYSLVLADADVTLLHDAARQSVTKLRQAR